MIEAFALMLPAAMKIDPRPDEAEIVPHDLVELRALSAAIGSDPLLTQGAGGNTSVKDNGLLWIKASGTWLAQALEHDIFVSVRVEPLLEAVRNIAPEAEQAQQFCVVELNPRNLRPSIETTVHALMPPRVVLHVHCVDTIAWAVQVNAEAALSQRLYGLNWAYIPYARPGLPLALEIQRKIASRPDVLVLGNHGLVVAAETVAEAETLLREVKRRVALPPRSASLDTDALAALAATNPGYRLPENEAAHAVALDRISVDFAAGGSLYPDHVIFLGEGVAVAEQGEYTAAVSQRPGISPPMILFPGQGVLMRSDASPGAEVMARCLADVCTRIPADASVRYLTRGDHLQLTDWDAEKYRQELNRAKSA